MSGRVHKRLRALLAVFLLLSARAQAQSYRKPVEEPRLLTLRVDQASTGVYAEGYDQTTTSGGSSSTQTRLFVGPLIGLGLSGSVYHPNLFEYRLTTDGAVGYREDEFKGNVQQKQTEFRFLGAFVGTAKLLENKPLNGTLYGGYSQTYQDYDFFNRIYIDRWRYGGGLRYTAGPFDISGTAYRETQDATGYGTPMKSDTTTATAQMTHTRAYGMTSLAGTLTGYERNDFGVLGRGNDFTLSAADTEEFGSRKQFHSLVQLSMNHLENSWVDYVQDTNGNSQAVFMKTPSDLFNALGNLRVDHTERLTSQYSLNYSRNTYGSAKTDNLNGSANLQHRLFESLTSQLNLQGYRYSAGFGSDRQDSWQFGGGPGFTYVKKLTDSSSMTLYDTVSWLHTDVQSTGGIIPVIDEQYTFGAGQNGTITLRQPNVLVSTIMVTDATRPPPGYILGQDYDLIPNGQLTLIQRRTISQIPVGGTVLVSYNFTTSPSGAYDTLVNGSGLRFDFLNHHWSVFTRMNLNQNYGAANLVLQDLTDWVVGTEATWRFLRAGAEYEIYDSNLSPFTATRFFQTLTFRPEESSTLSLSLTESFLDYESANRREQNYAAIVRYTQSLTRHLGLNLDAGVNQRAGPGLDETVIIFRPQLQYAVGKFSAAIGYDFGYDEYLGTETRVRNMGYIRLRKEF